jgi:hypothetical protein
MLVPSYPYPDYKITWADGSPLPAELHAMLLAGLPAESSSCEIEHGEFAWQEDGSLRMTFRLRVTRYSAAQVWDVSLLYPAEESAAALPEAATEEREGLTMMVMVNIREWLDTGCLPSEDGWRQARLRKKKA